MRPLDYLHVGDAKIIEITPYRDQNGHRMIIYRFGNWRPNEISVDELFLVSVILMELGSLEPIGQVVGGVGIFDLKDLSISQVMHLSPTVIQKLLALLVVSSHYVIWSLECRLTLSFLVRPQCRYEHPPFMLSIQIGASRWPLIS